MICAHRVASASQCWTSLVVAIFGLTPAAGSFHEGLMQMAAWGQAWGGTQTTPTMILTNLGHHQNFLWWATMCKANFMSLLVVLDRPDTTEVICVMAMHACAK